MASTWGCWERSLDASSGRVLWLYFCAAVRSHMPCSQPFTLSRKAAPSHIVECPFRPPVALMTYISTARPKIVGAAVRTPPGLVPHALLGSAVACVEQYRRGPRMRRLNRQPVRKAPAGTPAPSEAGRTAGEEVGRSSPPACVRARAGQAGARRRAVGRTGRGAWRGRLWEK